MEDNYKEKELKNIEEELMLEPESNELLQKKAILLADLAMKNLWHDRDQVEGYTKQCYEIGIQIEDDYVLGKYYHVKGSMHYIYFEYPHAIDSYEKALVHYTKSGNLLATARIYTNLALVLNQLYQFKEAKAYLTKAIVIYQKYDDERGLATAYNNMGIVNRYLKNYKRAILYYKKDLEISIKRKDKVTIARAYNNLAAVYLVINELDLALSAVKKSISIAYRTK